MNNKISGYEDLIGVIYRDPSRKHRNIMEVVDILTTTNMAGEVVKTRFVSKTVETLMGQHIFDRDVVSVTIQKNRI